MSESAGGSLSSLQNSADGSPASSPTLQRYRLPPLTVVKVTPESVELSWEDSHQTTAATLFFQLCFRQVKPPSRVPQQHSLLTDSSIPGPIDFEVVYEGCNRQRITLSSGLKPTGVYAFRLRARKKFKQEGGFIQDGAKPIWLTEQQVVELELPAPLDAETLDHVLRQLFTSIQNKDVSKASQLLGNYMHLLNPESRDQQGQSLLMTASRFMNNEKNTAVLDALLDMGANPNSTTAVGKTALMIASSVGLTAALKRLTTYRANVNQQDQSGTTALMYAADQGHASAVQFLLQEAGADPQIEDITGNTALTRLCMIPASSAVVVRHLLDAGAKAEFRNKDGNTALMLASLNGNGPVVECLLNSFKAKPQSRLRTFVQDRNLAGHSAMDLATAGSHERIQNLLKQIDRPTE